MVSIIPATLLQFLSHLVSQSLSVLNKDSGLSEVFILKIQFRKGNYFPGSCDFGRLQYKNLGGREYSNIGGGKLTPIFFTSDIKFIFIFYTPMVYE